MIKTPDLNDNGGSTRTGSSTPARAPKPATPWYKKTWVIIAAVVVVIALLCVFDTGHAPDAVLHPAG